MIAASLYTIYSIYVYCKRYLMTDERYKTRTTQTNKGSSFLLGKEDYTKLSACGLTSLCCRCPWKNKWELCTIYEAGAQLKSEFAGQGKKCWKSACFPLESPRFFPTRNRNKTLWFRSCSREREEHDDLLYWFFSINLILNCTRTRGLGCYIRRGSLSREAGHQILNLDSKRGRGSILPLPGLAS